MSYTGSNISPDRIRTFKENGNPRKSLFYCFCISGYVFPCIQDATLIERLNDTGDTIAIIDLAWPQGIQSGLSTPVALLLNESAETQEIVSGGGYRYYTSVAESYSIFLPIVV